MAGITVVLAMDQRRKVPVSSWAPWLACGLLGASPDLDLLYPGAHRTATHSLFAAGIVFLATTLVTRVRAGQVNWRLAAAFALAYATHLLTDYFGVDYGDRAGIQLLWPWSGELFISEWSLFRATERHDPLSFFAITMNMLALAQELLVIGPIAAFVWLRRRRLTTSPAARPRMGSPRIRDMAQGLTQTPDGQ